MKGSPGFQAAVVIVLAAAMSACLSEPSRSGPRPEAASNAAVIEPGETMESIILKAARVVPSTRQWAWQEREFTAFVHFGMNTFTDREWGEGTEDPALFHPSAFDARQWIRVLRDAGMRMVIVTAKHHDGFCLWPTALTSHSVRASPWREGRGDVIGDVAEACREAGLAFGVYLSPWDRHEPSYGDSPRYNEFFRAQLRELLTGYGSLDEVWFDGAVGEGPNGRRQEYDWTSYYRLIRELQPGAVIAIMGPDVRWVGTESGYGRETEWSVLPVSVAGPGSPDDFFVPRDLTGEDLGSREKLAAAKALIWYPAETDVSIRPGWFHHPAQDGAVKSPEKLLDIYENSVGRNGVLLLNVPPDRRGLIHESDAASLLGLRRILDGTYGLNLAAGASLLVSGAVPGHEAEAVLDGDPGTYWAAPEGTEAAGMEFSLVSPASFDRAVLQEYIRTGQRVEAFRLESWDGGGWVEFAKGTTVGHKRILRFPVQTASRIRLTILGSRSAPTLAAFGLYRTPLKGEER